MRCSESLQCSSAHPCAQVLHSDAGASHTQQKQWAQMALSLARCHLWTRQSCRACGASRAASKPCWSTISTSESESSAILGVRLFASSPPWRFRLSAPPARGAGVHVVTVPLPVSPVQIFFISHLSHENDDVQRKSNTHSACPCDESPAAKPAASNPVAPLGFGATNTVSRVGGVLGLSLLLTSHPLRVRRFQEGGGQRGWGRTRSC